MKCRDFDSSVEQLLAEEISSEERERLLLHAEDCADCRQMVDLHHRLLASQEEELPAEEAFAVMRGAVLRQIAENQPIAKATFLEWLGFQPIWAAGLAAAALLLFFGGGWIGRQTGTSTVELAGMTTLLEDEASNNIELADVENSPYIYSNVSFEPGAGEVMELSFDVTRHMELSRPSDDPLVREILVQSLLNPSPVGTRLAALNHARSLIDPQIKQALILSLFNDSSQAVRLRALETLSPYGEDPEVQAALMAVLRGEESVPIRLQAMDLLAQGGLSDERYGKLLQGLGAPEDRALLVRAAGVSARQQP